MIENSNHADILLVEDQVIIAASEKIELEKYGYRVSTAFSGEDAVKYVSGNRDNIDLVLMDIDLGKGMDGTAAAQKILDTVDIPIVFLSSHTEPRVVDKTEKITSYGYVVKNSGITVLDASIKMAFKLFDANRRLNEKGQHYESLFTNNPEPVLLVDPCTSGICDANPAAERYYGHPHEELLSMKISRLNGLTPENSVAHLNRLKEHDGNSFETMHMLADGRKRYVEIDTGDITVNGKNLIYEVIHDITDRKRMEIALEEEREKLSEAQRMARLGYWKWDIRTGNVEWTEGVYKMFGRDPDTFSPDVEKLKELSPWPDSLSNFSDGLKHVSESPEENSFEQRFLLPNGDTGYYFSVYKGVYDEAGQAVAIIGTAMDITKQKNAEIKLRENETLLKAVLDNLPVGISVDTVDPSVEFSYMNDNFPLFFRTTKEALAKPDSFWEAVYEDEEYRAEIRNRVLKDIKNSNGNPVSWQNIPISRKGEETKYVDSMNIPITERNMMVGVVWDVTRQNTLEKDLRGAKEFSEAMLNSFPGIIYIYDIVKREIVYSNTGISDILGYNIVEIREMGTAMIKDLMHPDDYAVYLREIIPRYESLPENQFIEHEYRMRHKDGRWRWLRSRESIFKRTENGAPLKIFGVITDVTEKRLKDNEIRQLLSEKELLLKEVHHRIKNNMTIIINLLSLQKDQLQNPKFDHIFQDAIGRLNSMQVLYDELYLTEDYKNVSVRQYIEQIVKDIKEILFRESRVQIETDIGDCFVDSKKALLLGIIINELLTNALKHAFAGRSDGKIKISVKRINANVSLVFEDDGSGYDPETRTGLGLTLIESIANQLDGSLATDCSKGTRYDFIFPFCGS